MQDCSNSSALAMELLQSCTKPSIWCHRHWWALVRVIACCLIHYWNNVDLSTPGSYTIHLNTITQEMIKITQEMLMKMITTNIWKIHIWNQSHIPNGQWVTDWVNAKKHHVIVGAMELNISNAWGHQWCPQSYIANDLCQIECMIFEI